MKFRSYSGDWYEVPDDQEEDIHKYLLAVRTLNEEVMLYYEEGSSGWKSTDGHY